MSDILEDIHDVAPPTPQSEPEAGIGPFRLPATHVESAIWRIDRVQLPMFGGWQVRVEILVNDFEKVSLEDRIELLR